MGFAITKGLSFKEIDNMTLDEFEITLECLNAFSDKVNVKYIDVDIKDIPEE